MASLEYFVVAEDVSVDQATNRISLFNIVDSFRASHLPMLVPTCVAVTVWRRERDDEERDFQSVLRIILPDGQTHQIEANFRMINPRHRIINKIKGMPIPAAGELRFEILLNGQHAASHVVTVEQQPPEEAPAVTH